MKKRADVELYGSKRIHAVKVWLQMVKMDLAKDKMEAILITKSIRKDDSVLVRVGNHKIACKSTSWGVMIDAKVNFKGHLDYVREKAVHL